MGSQFCFSLITLKVSHSIKMLCQTSVMCRCNINYNNWQPVHWKGFIVQGEINLNILK